MSKNGYDKFFQTARKVATSPNKREVQAKSQAQAKSQLRPKRARKTSWKMGLISAMGASISLWGAFNHELIEKFVDSIEVSLMGAALAESKPSAETAKPKNDHDDKSRTTAEVKNSNSQPADLAADNSETTEVSHLQKLADRKRQLDGRESEINRMEEEVNKQKIEVEKKLKELEEMRNRISATLENRVKIDEEKVEGLVQMYSNMKPPQAAKVFETMDEDLAVEIIGRMKKKNAAEIMNLLKPEKAQVISERYAGYSRRPASSGEGNQKQ